MVVISLNNVRKHDRSHTLQKGVICYFSIREYVRPFCRMVFIIRKRRWAIKDVISVRSRPVQYMFDFVFVHIVSYREMPK